MHHKVHARTCSILTEPRNQIQRLENQYKLKENFLIPQGQTSFCEDLPYRTPWHKAWKKKTYNVFGHVMGQYKGPLNPQAHGQNASESLRVFHGGDNM